MTSAARISSGSLASDAWNACAAPWKRCAPGRRPAIARHLVDGFTPRRATSRREVERDRDGGNWPGGDRQRSARLTRLRDGGGGTCPPAVPPHVDVFRVDRRVPLVLGATSSTTRYWFRLREHGRDLALPEGVVSACRRCCGVTPRRAAVVAVDVEREARTARPAGRCSTSAQLGRWRSGRRQPGATAQLDRVGIPRCTGTGRVSWLRRSRSCTGLACRADARHLGELRRRSRRMTLARRIAASRARLQVIRMRPRSAVALVPSTPMKDDRLATAGSRAMTSASACCRSPSRRTRSPAARRSCRRSRRCPDREEALRDRVEPRRSAPARRPRPTGSDAGAEHVRQRPVVERDRSVESALADAAAMPRRLGPWRAAGGRTSSA